MANTTTSSLSPSSVILATQSQIPTNTADTTTTALNHYELMEWYQYPTGIVMDLVHTVHDMTGFNYALSIATVTVLFRLTVNLPLGIMATRVDPTLEQDIDRLHQQVQQQKLQKSRTTKQNTQLLSQQRDQLQARVRKRQFLQIALPLTNLSTFFIMMSGMRGLTLYDDPQAMIAGGMLWFPNLTLPDPSLALPLMSTLGVFLMTEVRADQMGNPTTTEWSPKWKLFRRSLPVLFFVALHKAPTAIFCAWIPYSTVSLFQIALLSQVHTVRAALGVRDKQNKNQSKEKEVQYFVEPQQKNDSTGTSKKAASNQEKKPLGSVAKTTTMRTKNRKGKGKR
ncbi:mitochondrial inner membrane protein OXA1-like [Seminavis robusta]|uniref:Mitochondrial inner membrane protein OXA1-like n=1 Tax=Seminavis robusta TaxID=568900 RepID=A0A9N8EEQ9_9STRA|nr:mitochondrial inner membrane protein OXA1-like [Seminavis robusta]|eukprot:Sro985_g228020.1 mitochondrial inner membrane protein OXA1-like (338) ;mRNA; r:19431-20444